MSKQSLSTGEKWLFFAAIPGVIIGAIVALFLLVALPASSEDPTVAWDPSVVVTAPNAGVDLPMQTLDGGWTADSGNGAILNATVQNDSIVIVMENEGASMTYWAGTFASSADVGDTITSNKLEMDQVVLSSASTKDFVIGDGTVSFELKAMGMTTTVVMNRA